MDKANNWSLTTKSLVKMSKKADAHRRNFKPNFSSSLAQNQMLGYWLKRDHHLKIKDLDHPCIDDLILLIKYRKACWDELNGKEKAVWGSHWGYTYKKRKPLHNKALKNLENIYINSRNRHLEKLNKIHTIKALRQNPYEKEDHDMTAKGSSNADNIPWESE